MPRYLVTAWSYVPLLILALAWEAISRSGLVSQYALPALTRVLSAWWGLLADPDYYFNIAASLSRGAAGLGMALIVGTTLGTAMASSRWTRLMIGPIVQLFYPMPKSALIPLTIIWFGIGSTSKIFLIFLACLLPITTATFNGVRGVDRTLLWSAASLGASRWSQIRDVAFMAAVPDILAGVQTAIALAFVLLVTSELMMSNEGLGFLIRLYGDGSQYPQMFAVSLTVMVLGFSANRGFRSFSDWVLRWRR
jgi:ABC-type nitrate/sulfonate/bicarbonate transport system permease component